MTTIKELALTFEPVATRNITELPSVPVSLPIMQKIGTDANGKDYEFYYIEVNGINFRMPTSVVTALKAILQKKPTLQNFAVTKTGEGKNTKYTVIPLD